MKIYNAIHSKKMQWNNQPVDNRDLTIQENRAWQQKIMKHELTKGEMEEKNENIKQMNFTEGKYKGDQ